MHRRRSFLGRFSSVLLATAVVTGGLVVSTATFGAGVAAADSAVPATVSPIATKTASQVTADALPTVQIDGIVWAQAIAGTGSNATVYAGGSFANARPAGAASGTNLTARGNLLAYNLSTGVLVSSFAPVLNGQVLAVAVSPDGTKVFVGGDFTTADGVTHNHLAAYSAATGKLISTFTPNVGGRIKTLVATNTAVYAGGMFGGANGNSVTRLAAFNTTNGALLNWLPTADYTVNAMVLTPDGSKVILGGAFQNINGSPAYGLAAVDATTGALVPWAANSVVQDAGTQAAILSLTTDGTSIYGTGYTYGTGGNLEGAFSADPATGNINWIEDCHGDTYGSFPMGGALYTVSHAHYCGNIGGYFQSNPWGINMRHSLAFTTTATGTITADPLGYTNWAGHSSPSLINWFPDFTTANVSGANQAAWSVTGNGQYLVEGGEFPTVNGVGQQGLVRFAVKPIAPAKSGPMVTGAAARPSLVSLSPGTVRVAFPSNWDRDDKTLAYKVVRNSNTAAPVYTVTGDSEFWNTPKLGFTDTGLTPGATYKYRIYVSDPDGNTYAGDTVSITLPTNAAPTSQYVQDVLAAGATHYWRFGEASGTTVYDWAGFDDDTAVGTVTRGAAGAINGDADGASTFDGQSAFAVNSTPVDGPNVFTESAWFKTTTTSGGKIVGFGNSSVGNSSSYDRHIYMDNNGYVYFGVYNNNSYTIASSVALNDGNWHQVTGTMSASGMAFYIDGKLAGTSSNNLGQPYSGYWRVGGDSSWAGGNYFAGTIDDVAIYPTSLSIGQVRQQYIDSGRTFPGIVAPADQYGRAVYGDSPALYYRLDETTGTAAADSSGNGNSGVYSGGVTLGEPSPVTGATGTGVTFDGVTGTVGSSVPTNNPTVYSEELWFKTTTVHGGKLIGFGNQNSGNSGHYDRHVYMLNNGQLVFGTYTGQLNLATSPATYNDGGWHYLVATQGSDGMKLYVDNQLVATNPQTGAENYAGYWRIGGDSDWGGDSPYFNGTIDEAAVYLSVLSPVQIATHFNAGAGVNHPPTGSFTSAVSKLGVAFTATAADSDGTVSGYAWNFGDGTSGTGASVNHTYASAGTYPVTLTLTDNGGASTVVTNQVVTVANVAPTASFTSVVSNLAVAFNGSGSADSDGTIASYAWNYGDGSPVVTTTTPTSSYTYAAGGNYTVSLTVTDNDGASTTATNPVTAVAPPANVPPTASFSAAVTKLAVAFDGSASADSDGAVASYAWNYGDGSGVVTNTTPKSTYTYATAGTYTVTLTVTDNDGAATSVSKNVTAVANVAPTASFSATVTKSAVAFDGSASADSDGTIASYAWNYGDGSAVVTNTTPTSDYTYAAAGTYSVVLTVTDDNGATGTVTKSVTAVANVAPTASFTSTSSGLAASFDGSASADSDGTIASYAWNYGDGSAVVNTTTPTSGYTYAAAGTYSVVLTVTDNNGGTGSVTRPVVISSPNVAVDAFGRTAAGGWGAADVGGSWSMNGTASLFSVGGGVGSMKMASAGAGPSGYLNAASGLNVNGTVDVTLSAAPTGGGTYISLAGRHGGRSDYRVRVRFQPSSTTIAIDKLLNGTETALKQVTIAGLTYDAGDTVRIRLQITGSGTSTISARAWKTSAVEPSAWQVSTTDTEPTLQGAGGVGVQSYLSGSSTAPVTATFDNLSITTNVTP